MQVRRRLGLYSVLLITLSTLTSNALAGCLGSVTGPPCLEYERSDAVFIGVASRVVQYGTSLSDLRTTVHFTVEEIFKGVRGTALVLDLDHCGHSFKEGERYLVYAHRNPNNQQLDVRVRSTRTRPLAEATEDLQYIRGLASAEGGSRVFGKVAQYGYHLRRKDFGAEALKSIKVILEGTDQRHEVLTDSEGRYEFKRLPAGTYQIQAEIPAHLSVAKQTIRVSGRGCVPFDLAAMSKGLISGRVLDVTGKPFFSVPVSLVSADASAEEINEDGKDKVVWWTSHTDMAGRYQFPNLPPGRYLLIINRTEFERSRDTEMLRQLPQTFYPGVSDLNGATVIVVGKDDEPRDYDFRFP